MFEALQDFLGIVGGVEKPFANGDKINAETAKELGLDGKPELAKKVGK